eukprot:CAMPEP_0118865064 /NCGR_PEP_ID=MMETSP1163-20130328/9449_1 /TAXON_ID=124430 /ORGANISM="Phaeomonas parva, Strain CCMP2877" /LENGTH=254 /DNA_ID=CAMNT_0006799257 /DNA_START=1 /DNA_END=765 /DNA_ORIENTATION=+
MKRIDAENKELVRENATVVASEEQLRRTVEELARTLEVEQTNRREWATARSQLLRQFCESDNTMKGLSSLSGGVPKQQPTPYNHVYHAGVSDLRRSADSLPSAPRPATDPTPTKTKVPSKSSAKATGRRKVKRRRARLTTAATAKAKLATPTRLAGKAERKASPTDSPLRRRTELLRARRAALEARPSGLFTSDEHEPRHPAPRRESKGPDSIDELELELATEDWAAGNTEGWAGDEEEEAELLTDLDAMSSIA